MALATVQDQAAEAVQLLALAASALRSYGRDLVVVGGMVPYLYRYLPQFRNPGWESLRTLDVDLTLPRSLALVGREPPGVLLQRSGIVRVDGRGADGPGAAYYQLARHGTAVLAPVHLEFLTSKMGEGTEQFRSVGTDIRTQTLRYLDLVHIEPLQMDLQAVPEAGIGHELIVQLPQPALYILPKPLIRKHRALNKRGKDMAYVYDVILLSRLEWATARRVLDSAAFRSGERQAWCRRALSQLDDLFANAAAAGATEVAREMAARNQSISARAIAETVQDWLDAVWPEQGGPRRQRR